MFFGGFTNTKINVAPSRTEKLVDHHLSFLQKKMEMSNVNKPEKYH